jgi:serine/threonine-protein kinase
MIRSFLKLTAYFIAFITVGAVAAFIAYQIVNFEKTGDVPLLVGKSLTQAEELLKKRKMFLRVDGEEHHSEIEEGYIVKQDVEPGGEIPVGTEVRVIVSKGPEVYSMPSFEGQMLKDAKLTLNNLGIKIKKIMRVHSDTVGKGRIIAQRPLPGNIESNKINFLVSLGSYDVSYKCPSFVNMSVDDARILAKKLGIELIEQDEGSRIIFQKPEAGAIIKKGDSVEVTLGRGWGMWF